MLPQVETRCFHVFFDIHGIHQSCLFCLVMCLLTIAIYLKGYRDFQLHNRVSAVLYKYLLKATIIMTFFSSYRSNLKPQHCATMRTPYLH